jgi:hypothetical protein
VLEELKDGRHGDASPVASIVMLPAALVPLASVRMLGLGAIASSTSTGTGPTGVLTAH